MKFTKEFSFSPKGLTREKILKATLPSPNLVTKLTMTLPSIKNPTKSSSLISQPLVSYVKRVKKRRRFSQKKAK